MNLVAGAVAVLLIGSAAAPAVPGMPGERAWVPGEHGAASIELSVVNWGELVDLAAPSAVYATGGPGAPLTRVIVSITPPGSGMHGFYGRLTAPDAEGGEVRLYCGDEYRRIDVLQRCIFEVPMSRGLNHLRFDLQSASWTGIITQEGVVLGGVLTAVPIIEEMLPDGSWGHAEAGGELALRGEQTSALRYRIMNTGDLPFQAPESCLPNGIVWPYQQLMCTLRNPRPAYALAGDYAVPVRIEDPVGGVTAIILQGTVRVKGSDLRPNRAGMARLTGGHE